LGMRCWGNNNFGQLGDLTTTNSSVPVTPLGFGNIPIVSVGCGQIHTCVVENANDEGFVACFGGNGRGQLGQGTGAGVGLERAASVTAGLQHSCAALLDGTAWCWG